MFFLNFAPDLQNRRRSGEYKCEQRSALHHVPSERTDRAAVCHPSAADFCGHGAAAQQPLHFADGLFARQLGHPAADAGAVRAGRRGPREDQDAPEPDHEPGRRPGGAAAAGREAAPLLHAQADQLGARLVRRPQRQNGQRPHGQLLPGHEDQVQVPQPLPPPHRSHRL